jgi:hypothetical protein
MADSTDKVIFNPKPIRVGLAWGLTVYNAAYSENGVN